MNILETYIVDDEIIGVSPLDSVVHKQMYAHVEFTVYTKTNSIVIKSNSCLSMETEVISEYLKEVRQARSQVVDLIQSKINKQYEAAI